MLPGIITCRGHSKILVKRPTTTSKSVLHTQIGMLKAFASRVLSGPSDLQVAVAELPERTAQACLRLLDLLEFSSDGGRQ